MSVVYNPEADTIAQIERLEIEARDLRRRLVKTRSEQDRRVQNRQLNELQDQIAHLQARLA